MNIDYYFKFEHLAGSFQNFRIAGESSGANTIHAQYLILSVNLEHVEDWSGFDDRFEFLPLGFRDFKTSFAGHMTLGRKSFARKEYLYLGYVGLLLDKKNPMDVRLCILPCHERTKDELPQVTALCGAGFHFYFDMKVDFGTNFVGIQSYHIRDPLRSKKEQIAVSYVFSYSNLRKREEGAPKEKLIPKRKPLLRGSLIEPDYLTFSQRMGLVGFVRSVSEILWDNPLCPMIPAADCLEHSIIQASTIQHEGIRHWCSQVLVELLVCNNELGRQLGALFHSNLIAQDSHGH